MAAVNSNESKLFYIILGCAAIGCLFGSFAGNLEKFEVWKQTENTELGFKYDKVFVISESQQNQPFGFYRDSAFKLTSNYEDLKLQKFVLLGCSILGSGLALLIGESKILEFEIEAETQKIESSATKEYKVRQIKQKWALMTEAQKQLFREELRELIELVGGDESLEATEINETDKFINANYLLQEGHNIDVVITQTWGYQTGTPEHEEMKSKFLTWMEE